MPNGQEEEQEKEQPEEEESPRERFREAAKQQIKQRIRQAVAQATKKAIAQGAKLLLANPYFWAIVVIVLVVLIFIFLAGAAFRGDFGKTGTQAASLVNQSQVNDLLTFLGNLNIDQSIKAGTLKQDLEKIQQKVKELEPRIANWPANAQAKYQQLKTLSESLSIYADAPQLTPGAKAALQNTIDQMKGQVLGIRKDLGELVFTDSERSDVIAAIKELMKQGAIVFDGGENGIEATDILGGKVKDSLLRLVAEAGNNAKGNGYKIQISTVKNDHNKETISGNISNHYYGRAIDVGNEAIANQLMPFLFENRQELKIDELFYNGLLDKTLDRGKPYGKSVTGHSNHIHIAVFP